MTRELLGLAEKQREAFQQLVEISVFGTYTNLFFAPLSHSREEQRSVVPDSGGNGSLPLQDYDELTVQEVSKKLEDLTEQEVRAIRSYEKRHKNRETLLERLDHALV